MARICPWLALVFAAHAHAQEAPVSGPERVEWMREHLVNTVSKFEFTQGYSFRKSPEDLEPFMEAIKARGFSVWDQHPEGYIWRDEHFEHLERSIQVAAEVGLEVWATLVPPSGKQEIARWPLEDRQEYFEGGSLAGCTLGRDAPPMAFAYLAADRQSDARSLVDVTRMQTLKHVEDPIEVFLVEVDPVVGHHDPALLSGG